MSRARAAIILAAGQGTRMKSELPKVLHAVGGRPMLDWAIAAAQACSADRIIVVTGAHAPEVQKHAARRLGEQALAVQDPPLGTAHAVRAAEAALADFDGDVAVIYADVPLLQPRSLQSLFEMRTKEGGIAVLGFQTNTPAGYGRIVGDEDGRIVRIVEEKDATEAERRIEICNSGVICADARVLFQILGLVKNENAKQEYYLTDVVALARSAGIFSRLAMCESGEVMGVNSRLELAAAEAAFQARARREAMEAGVTLLDPSTVYFSYDTVIAADVIIEPNVVFGPGVKVARGARIYAFCHFENAEIGEGVRIGPFARLRPGAKLMNGVKIGNFVEVKNSTMGPKAQASHLAYIGDANVGARANLGAGTITCNYDGFDKHRTEIGEDAFIGSDTALVAPVKVGARTYTGAGSVITKDVPDGALGVGRSKQLNFEGWSDRFRATKQKKSTP